MGLTVIGTLLLQRAGKILPHKTTAAFKMAQSSNSIFFQCLLLGSQSPALKPTYFTNRLFLKTRDISPRQSHRVGYPWHSTQMVALIPKATGEVGSESADPWTLTGGTGFQHEESDCKMKQPQNRASPRAGSSIHSLLLIIVYTKDAEAHYGQIKCPRHLAFFLWFSQSVSQACNPILENLHIYLYIYMYFTHINKRLGL